LHEIAVLMAANVWLVFYCCDAMRIRGVSTFLGVLSQVFVFILCVQLRALYRSLYSYNLPKKMTHLWTPSPTHNSGTIIHITAHCVLCALVWMCFCVFRLRVDKTVKSMRMTVHLKHSANYTTTQITNPYSILLLDMLIVHQLFQHIFRCFCNKAVYYRDRSLLFLMEATPMCFH